MLFSGVTQSYRCPDCNRNFSSTIPTSILPILVVAVVATAFWSELFLLFLEVAWVAMLLAVVIALVSVPIICLFLGRIVNPWTSTGECPECATKLTPAGGGFVDGAPPSMEEVLVYLLAIGIPAGMWLAATAIPLFFSNGSEIY